MRTVWTWLALGGALLAMYFAQTVFGLTGSQLTTILLFVGLLALNYQVNTLKEANPRLACCHRQRSPWSGSPRSLVACAPGQLRTIASELDIWSLLHCR